ncbi:MAG: metallophosphoesterase [Acidobacteria bacterium]|nr:metallophosphoesterase [Acidobacteriota bacterium]
MTRRSTLLLMLVAFVVGGFGYGIVQRKTASAQTSESFGGNIVLGRPTDRSITVNVLFTANQDSVYLEYGENPGLLTQQTAPKQNIRANEPFEDIISGLQPNRRYFYRVRYRAAGQTTFGASAEHSFHTQRAAGSAFTFTLIADSHLFTTQHCDPARYALALKNALDDNPDFHIDLGDTFRTDTITNNSASLIYQQVLNRQIAHRPYFNILTHSVPLFLVNGNHDSEYLYYTKPESGENPNLPLWSTNARLLLFPNPRPDSFYSGDQTMYPGVEGGLRESYYAWEWGDALFVVLDPYWEMPERGGQNWGTVHGDKQFAWFRDTLRKSKAKYKFVFEHHLHGQSRGGVEVASQFEWGGRERNGNFTFPQNRPTWDKPFHDLMAETGVTIYFQGHDHLFARGFYNGVTYVSVPQPGAGPDPTAADYFPGNVGDGNFDAYPASHVLPNSGHVRVTVSPNGVKTDYVTVKLPRDKGTNKTVAYTFTVGQPAAPNSLALVSAGNFANIGGAAESLVSAFGNGLAGAAGATIVNVKDSAGVERAGRVLFASATQVNFMLPAGMASGPATVTVLYAGNPVGTTTYQIETVAPAMFTANGSGLGAPAAVAVRVRADGSQTIEPVVRCTNTGCVPVPLDLGAATDQLYLVLFATGVRNRAQLLTGADVGVRIGGELAEVQYAGAQGDFFGLDQLNVKVPRTLIGRGDVAVIFSVAGRSATPVMVNIR